MGDVPKTKQVLVDMPLELKEALDAEAEKSGRTRSAVIRSLLRHGLGTCGEFCAVCRQAEKA